MRTLNCKRVAGIISLYVAGDLVGAPEREVGAHLAACEACRRLAKEFAESNSLLTQACTLPEFDSEFYSGIRSAVLDKIARDRRLLKSPLFHRRWLYATAVAALVIAAGVVLQHFGNSGRQTSPGLALAPLVTDQPILGQVRGTGSSAPSRPSRGTPKIPSQKMLALVSPRASSGRLEKVQKANTSDAAQTARDISKQIAQAMPLGETPPSSSGRAAASQVSRIEIQTADPNIRIIWLGRRESRESEQTNHDQHQDENGNRK